MNGLPKKLASVYKEQRLEVLFHVDVVGSIVGGAECTPAAEEALKAWLAANTPSQPGRGSAYTGNHTPGQMLATPAMQDLLQQLRISTPALGAHVSLLATCGADSVFCLMPTMLLLSQDVHGS